MMKFLEQNPIVVGVIASASVFLFGAALTIALGFAVMGQASPSDNHGGSMGAGMIWSFGFPASLFVSVLAGVLTTVILNSKKA